MMRFLLIIPALLLFLSNIPFMQRMDMGAPAKKSGCCKKKEASKGTCHMQDEKPQQKENSCHKEDQDRKCSKQTESTCVCTCFFHFTAPDQIVARPQFNCNSVQQSLAVYFLHHWKDPHLAVQGQPPDQL